MDPQIRTLMISVFSCQGDVLWSMTAGGPMTDRADAVAVDSSGMVFLAGSTGSGAVFGDQSVGPAWANTFLVAYEAEGVSGVETIGRMNARLAGNHPNPFNPLTRIDFSLNRPGKIRLQVFDLSGARIAVLADGWREAGAHQVSWDGRDSYGQAVSSGVYLYQLETNQGRLTRRMVLVR